MTFRSRTKRRSVRAHQLGGFHAIQSLKALVRIDRISFLRGCLFFFVLILFLRLFNLQVLSYEDYRTAAEGEHQLLRKIHPDRGSIFLRERSANGSANQYLMEVEGEKLFPAVTNREYMLVYAVPKSISDPEKVADQLMPLFDIPKEEPKSDDDNNGDKDGIDPREERRAWLVQRLSKKNDSYEVIKRKVPAASWDIIKKLYIGGINASPESYRFYPEKGLGGHLFGFVGYSGESVKGLYGLEGYFDDILKGKEGSLRFESDALGALIPIGEKRVVEAVQGSNLVLTIDRTIQLMACDRLSKWVLKHGADGGTVVIMNPNTGALYAMCSVPDFDPENYFDADVKQYPNPSIFTPYEPGSIFKPFTMAMGIDSEKVAPATTYVDTGEVKIGSFTIKNSDSKAHGKQTMMDVLDQSLNTGVIFVARKVGIDAFRDYVKNFGFGKPTGIELDREVSGTIAGLNEKQEIYMATASFGQGLSVTPLQITTAYAALANGGNLVQPYVVDEIIKSDGSRHRTNPKVVRRVISEKTSTLISSMLVNVVRKGHGKRAGVDGYYVAGKTGTAQVARSDGRGYERDITIGSFAGFAPVDNPRFVMLVKVDHPRDVQWAESSAAPLFGELAKFLLQYFEVPPDETESRSKN